MVGRIVSLPAVGLLLAAVGAPRAGDKDDLQDAWKVDKAVEDGAELTIGAVVWTTHHLENL